MSTAPNASPIHARGEVKDAFEGRKILEAFYAMQPNLSAIARALTGRDEIMVKPTAGGTYTDNKDIFLMLSPDMVIEKQHERLLCGKRNADGLMMCEACRKYEAVVVPLYHEMGHIIYGSFAEVDDKWVNEFFREEVVEHNRFDMSERRLRAIEKRLNSTPWRAYMELAPLISPFLPMLLNALEDSRINAGVIRANPGAKKMFRADIAHVMDGGIRTADGRVLMWSERPLNAQFTIGALLAASGIPIDPHWLDDEVIEALQDPVLAGLLGDVSETENVKGVFEKSIPILERARELGFLRHEDDEEPPPSPDAGDDAGEPDASDEDSESGDGSTSASGENDDEPDSGDNEPEEGDDSDELEDGDGHSDSDDDDEDSEENDDGKESGDEEGDEEGDDEGDDEGEGEDDEQSASGGSDSQDEGSDDFEDGEDGEEPDANPDAKRQEVELDGGDDEQPTDEYGGKGSPDEVAEDFDAFNPHEEERDPEKPDEQLQKALDQQTFEGPSQNVNGLDFRTPDHSYFSDMVGYMPDESVVADPKIVQRALGPLRVAFSENKQSDYQKNKKSGRVNPRVLGRRIPKNDPRLFRKKREPAKRDYHVVIGMDISGSTVSQLSYNDRTTYLQMIKTMVLLQSEMLARVGVPFEVYAHTGGLYKRTEHGGWDYNSGLNLNIAQIKGINEPFNDKVRKRIRSVKSTAANLDGHTLEFYRQRLDETDATDNLIIYYTDGAMPAENYEEEKEILQRECTTIKRRNYDVLAVAIQNNDPQDYGLDTVRVDKPEDMAKVVMELQRRLK